MTMTQVVHSTDIGETLKVVAGKVEVDATDLLDDLTEANKAAGIYEASFAQADMGKQYIDATEIQAGIDPVMPTFEELSSKMAALIAANPAATRLLTQYGTSVWGYVKGTDGEWQMTTNYALSGVGGVMAPYCKVVNNAVNPLFVDGAGAAYDLSRDISQYSLYPQKWMRMVIGAAATWVLDKPQRLRSLELLTVPGISPYVQGSLAIVVTYIDGTTHSARAYPYNSNYYLGDQLDQTKRVKSVQFTVDAKTLSECGAIPTLHSRDFATGRLYVKTHADYGLHTPVLAINYIYGYHLFSDYQRFYSDDEAQVDITSEFTATASIAALEGTSAANLVDGLGTTYYQSSTTANALTLTFAKNLATPPRIIKFIDVKLTPIVGSEAVFNSLSSVVVVGKIAVTGSNLISNTRHINGLNAANAELDTDGNYVMRFLADTPNAYPYPEDELTVTLNKTVAGQFKVAGVTILGESPLAMA